MSKTMKFAVPTEGGKLCAHFGHCEKFAVIETNDGNVTSETMVEPPVHQPGVYPKFLADQGVHVIIAGGMGQKAQDLFAQNNIQVCMGVMNGSPKTLVESYMQDSLQTGQNLCDH